VAANSLRAIRSGALPGARNMALDEALAAAPVPTLRLYRWEPWTLSLGWFQAVAAEDLAPWRDAGYGVTRRATGGGAILHGDEVTYALVLPADDPRIPGRTEDSYRWLHGAVRDALATVGVVCDARARAAAAAGETEPFFCFARTAPFDLAARGRKLVGSAQRRTRASFLQHGSIPLSPGGTAPGATSVAEERGSPVDPATLEDALVAAFARVLGVEPRPGEPTAEEAALARDLEARRYGNPAWVLRPWKRGGRPAGRVPPPPGPPGATAGGPAILLRAAVDPDRLRVLAAAGGARPDLPHARLRAADAALVPRRTAVPLSPERDPWDSTFRRSPFAGAQGAAGPEGLPPVSREVEEEALVLALRWDDPPAEAILDARRFNFRDLGGVRTGDPLRDAAALLRAILARAPGAARGPGARAILDGRAPPAAPSERELRDRLRRSTG
jgi:lipoate-protein ligase A